MVEIRVPTGRFMHLSLLVGCKAGCSGRLLLHEVSLQDTLLRPFLPWHFVPGSYEPSRWDEDRSRTPSSHDVGHG